ncbi:MAG: MATE family efflux transporter [Pseudomonadota bacterium]
MATAAEPAAPDAGGDFRTELLTLTRLAGPLVLAQLSQMGMGVADTIMAGRVSAAELAGVALGGNLYFPMLLFATGTVLALTPTVAQLNGAAKQDAVGEVVRQALWIALFGGLGLALYLRSAEPLYQWFGIDPLAIPIAARYLNATSYAAPALLGYFVLRYLCEGMSWTRPAMVLGVAGLALKIPLNLLFIYGEPRLGLPALGGAGCGWATAVIVWLQFLTLLVIVRRSHLRATGVFDRFSWPNLGAMLQLIKLGLPIGVTNSLEVALFSATTLLVGTLSVSAVAAHQIAMNIGGLAFMIPSALGMAAAIRVGHNVGAERLAAARRSGWAAIVVAEAFALLAIAVMLIGGERLTGLYSSESDVVETAAYLLLFVAGFQIFDAGQVACMGSLRGYKDTRIPMLFALLAYWLLGFPVARVLGLGGLGFNGLGVSGFWIGLILGLAVAAVCLFLRFERLSRRPDHIRGLALR